MAKNHESHRIGVVLFDAMYCLFEAKESRPKQLARVFKEEAGIDVTPKRIWKITQMIRHSLPPSSDYRRDWVFFNKRIIAKLRRCKPEEVPDAQAERIQQRILWDTSLYEVRDDMRALLGWFENAKLRMGIASNQYRAALDGMLDAFKVRKYFDQECIFTSDRIAAASHEVISKPHERFWDIVQRALEVKERPYAAPFVGNSLRNDAPATRYGHPVLLFDRCGHQRPLLPKTSESPLILCRSPNEIWAGIQRLNREEQ